ncbi:SRPBCC domain-containing protein [Rossellomorea sp. DA94]|uniref:SRPBCC domain-containing protein n=1 Tax=Rossellomorea sp. DA94 TaxID=3038653 RepID=UPI00244A526C|nr:SRPBCC domain-containing protein [Rossellomorea sp. DA94]WGG46556.1 SRPBCC domain-containing protein [Rossellomorea sp. DA94]
MSNSNQMLSKVENNRVLVLERIFDAPRDLVFSMFKEPEHLKAWWGPRGWELPVCRVDFRPGGVWHYCMKCVDSNQGQFYGMESWGKGVYKEIIEPEKIVYVDAFSDAEGNTNEDLPETEVTMEFIDMGSRTKLISRSLYSSEDALKTVMDMGMIQGITETWDRLEEALQLLNK